MPWIGQDNWPSVGFALAGGLVLFMGNLACQYAWPFVGLSVTEVVSASITVVAGACYSHVDPQLARPFLEHISSFKSQLRTQILLSAVCW